MEELTHAVVGDFTKIRERRFCDYTAEAGHDGEGLQELGRAHGLAHAVDASGMLIGGQPVEPLTDVVTFEQAARRH